MSRPFAAKYNGSCTECLEVIYEGDMVVFVSDELTHVQCPDILPEAHRAPCPSCFQIPAQSGACGCM